MYVYCNFDDYISARFLLSLQACTTRRFFSWAFSMHGSFISFIKPELKICIPLKTSSEVILLSGVTISCLLFGTSSEMTSILGIIVFLVRVACSVWSTYVKGADTKGACIADTYVGRAYIEGACTGSTYAKDICIGVASNKGTCIGSVCAIEHSEIHSQSFQILEIGSAR